MKNRVLFLALLAFLAVILQTSVFPFFGVYGIHPDPLLVLVVSVSLIRGSSRGALLGLCGGLLQDILLAGPVGLFGATKLLVGYLVGFVKSYFFGEQFIIPALATFAASVANSLLVIFFLSLFDPIRMPGSVVLVIFVKAAYNVALAPLFYNVVAWVESWGESSAAGGM